MYKITQQELQKNFGKKVAFYRKKMNKWTQSILADKMNVSINTISQIENGKTFISADRLANLANILKIEVYQLFMPDNIEYDDASDILAKYTDNVKDKIDNIRDDFLKKIKRKS